MKPVNQAQIRAQWKQQLRTTKLHKSLMDALGKPGGKPLDVQIWVRSMPADGLKKLKSLGFMFTTTLTPGRLVLGSIMRASVDKLLALPWVVYVEPPRFK
jgi:hypothetical protein